MNTNYDYTGLANEVVRGMSIRNIANELGISKKKVENRLKK